MQKVDKEGEPTDRCSTPTMKKLPGACHAKLHYETSTSHNAGCFSINGCWLQLFGRTEHRVSPVPESVASRFQHRWCWSQLFSTDATQSVTGCSILVASVATPGHCECSVWPPLLKQSPWQRLLGRKRICARGARELWKGGCRWSARAWGHQREEGGWWEHMSSSWAMTERGREIVENEGGFNAWGKTLVAGVVGGKSQRGDRAVPTSRCSLSHACATGARY